MVRKLVVAIMIGIYLSGCSQFKSINNTLAKQTEAALEIKVDKTNNEELVYKIRQEEAAKKKAEEEAQFKAIQEVKEKEEVKAKAEQEVNTQQIAKPEVQPVQSSAPKSVPKIAESKPVPIISQAPQQNSTSNPQQKHPVEYKGDIENEILVFVNQERAKVGAKTLVMNETLRSMARYKSNDMLQYDYFDHTSPNIGGLSNLAAKFRYSYKALGENIWMSKASSTDYLRQNTTAAKIMNGWMNSPGHKANILNPAFGKIGIGVTLSTDGLSHATQEFSN
jgi:uncharacterized protein YkwD